MGVKKNKNHKLLLRGIRTNTIYALSFWSNYRVEEGG